MRRSIHNNTALPSPRGEGSSSSFGQGEKGFTLIELLIVVGIVAILAAALAFSYQGWMGRYTVEKATKDLYSDLMTARVNAMTQQRMFFVTLNATNYTMSADTNENSTSDAGDTPQFAAPKPVQYALRWNGADPAGQFIRFDKRGLIRLPLDAAAPAAGVVISLTISASIDPDYDCIIIFDPNVTASTRINIGQMTGGNCIAK